MPELYTRGSPTRHAASRWTRATALTAAGFAMALTWFGASLLQDREAASSAESAPSGDRPVSAGNLGSLTPSKELSRPGAPAGPASRPISLLGGDWRPLPTPLTTERDQTDEPAEPTIPAAEEAMIPFDPASLAEATVEAISKQTSRTGPAEKGMFEGSPYAGPLPQYLFK